MSSYPEIGTSLETPYTVYFNLTQPFPSNVLQILFCYIPITTAQPAPSLTTPTGYPQVTSDLEVPIAYQEVNLTCNSSSADDCLQVVSVSTYLPPGLYQFVVHVMFGLMENATADVYYSDVPAVVAEPQLLDTDVSNPVVCGLLNGGSTADELTQASLASTITSALMDVYGASGLTANSSRLSCGLITNTSDIVADRLLAAMLNATRAMSNSWSPLAINTVNTLSTAAYSIASALTADKTTLSTSNQVWALVNLTSALTHYLWQANIGYQSGNDTWLDVYNLGFSNIAAVYGQLLTANTSDASLHCGVVNLMEHHFSSLLTTAMVGHQFADSDVSFSGMSYSASTSRIAAASNSSLSQLSLSIPAAASGDSTSSSGFFDVQRIIFNQSQTMWSNCFSHEFDPSLNTTANAALIPGPLYVIQLLDSLGAVYSVEGISTPIEFILPYVHENATESEFTPACAFYNRSSSSWSTAGCTSVVNVDSVSCACNHLTEFTLVAQPLIATSGSGQAQLSASQAIKHADLLGIFIMYLIPLVLATLLLFIAAVVCRAHASVVPWSKSVYALIVVVSMMRCVCLALLYFDNANSATTLFDQNPLSATTTALLLLPLILEVLLLLVLGYRYAVVRRKEGSGQIVNGRLDLRRASMYTGPAVLKPRMSEVSDPTAAKDRRRSMLQRLSVVVSSSNTPIVDPPNHLVPLGLAAVFTLAAVAALVGYLVLERHTGSSSTFTSMSALLVLTVVAALTVMSMWVVFLYCSVPNLKAVMRRGQALGWMTVFAFFLQSLLALSFAEQHSGSWYFVQSAGGVHVMLAIYAVVEAITLSGMALWWRWTLQWWRSDNKIDTIVTRYDTTEAKAQSLIKDKEVWNNTLTPPVIVAAQKNKLGNTHSADRDRLDAKPKSKNLADRRPSIAESLIFGVNCEMDDDNDDNWAEAGGNTTRSVVTSMESSRMEKLGHHAEEKTTDKEQVFSSETTIRSLPPLRSTSVRLDSSSTVMQLQALQSLQTGRPSKVWSNGGSINNTPPHLVANNGPMPTPLQLPIRRSSSSSVSASPRTVAALSASPLLLADEKLLNSPSQSSTLPSGVTTPLTAPNSSRLAPKRQLSIIGWELTPTAVPAAGTLSAPATARITQDTPASVPFSPLAPVTALSMLSAASSASATTAASPAAASPASVLSSLPTAESVVINRPQTAAAPLDFAELSSPTSSTTGTTADDGSIQLILTPLGGASELPTCRTNRLRKYITRATDEDEQKLSEYSLAPSPIDRRPRIERADDIVEPPSPLLLSSPTGPTAGTRDGYIIHPGKSARVSRQASVQQTGTPGFSPPLGSTASSMAASPSMSPTFRPILPIEVLRQGRSRAGRVSRSRESSSGRHRGSVAAIPTGEVRKSPSLTSASAVYHPQRRSSTVAPDERQRGSVVRSDSPPQQRAQSLQTNKVTVTRQTAPPPPVSQSSVAALPPTNHHRRSSLATAGAQLTSFIPPLDLSVVDSLHPSRAYSVAGSSADSSAAASSYSGSEVESDEDDAASPRQTILSGAGKHSVNDPARFARRRSLSFDGANRKPSGGRLASAASFSIPVEPHHPQTNNYL